MTARALIIGLLWVIVQSWLVPYSKYYVRGAALVGNHLPACSMFILLLFALLVNPLLRRYKRTWTLQPSELTIIWIVSSVAAWVPSMGFIAHLIPIVASPLYFASPANRWDELLLPQFAEWSIVWDRSAVRGFFQGGATSVFDIPWRAWWQALLGWSLFGLAKFDTIKCSISVNLNLPQIGFTA